MSHITYEETVKCFAFNAVRNAYSDKAFSAYTPSEEYDIQMVRYKATFKTLLREMFPQDYNEVDLANQIVVVEKEGILVQLIRPSNHERAELHIVNPNDAIV